MITGAGSGIGRAIATLFTQVGARVLFVDMATDAVREAAEEEQVLATFDQARALFGRVDILANVAAYRRKADTMTMPAAEWDRMHAVTARGGGRICRIWHPHQQHPAPRPATSPAII